RGDDPVRRPESAADRLRLGSDRAVVDRLAAGILRTVGLVPRFRFPTGKRKTPMRYPVILAGSMLVGIVSALPVAAQTAPPLAYVQPVAPQVVQDVQNRLRQAGAYNRQIDRI